MITFDKFCFFYKIDNPVFEKLDLSIKSNQITVLTGSNGSGKTTFCRLLIGLIKKYSGNLKIDGVEQKDLSITNISKKITYIKQEPAANIVSAIPREDLDIWIHKFCTDFNSDKKQLDEVLDYFILNKQADQPVWELSSGQMKRIGLAALLLNKDKFWLLDEPTSGLDNDLIDKLLELIKAQKEQKKGMMIISHRHDKFIDVADRILEIKNKKIMELV